RLPLHVEGGRPPRQALVETGAPQSSAPSMRVKLAGLGLVFGALAFTLALGAAAKATCAGGSWGDLRPYRHLCYSDIVPLYGTENLSGGRLPYIDSCQGQCDEYP